MNANRRLTLRLPEELASQLEALAAVTRRTTTDCVAEAICDWQRSQLSNEDIAMLVLYLREIREDLNLPKKDA